MERQSAVSLTQAECLDLFYLLRAGLRSYEDTLDNDPNGDSPDSLGNWVSRRAVESMRRTAESITESIALQNGGRPYLMREIRELDRETELDREAVVPDCPITDQAMRLIQNLR